MTLTEFAKEQGITLTILSRPVGPKDRDQALAQFRQKDPPYMDRWRLTVDANGITIETDYSKGIGLRESRRGKHFPGIFHYKGKGLTLHDLDNMLSFRPVDPTIAEVLGSLYLDANGTDQAFESWAADLGYDPDSRKAYSIYEKCSEVDRKLRSMLGDHFEALAELEDQ